jgi:hypothetical protein
LEVIISVSIERMIRNLGNCKQQAMYLPRWRFRHTPGLIVLVMIQRSLKLSGEEEPDQQKRCFRLHSNHIVK